MKLNQLKILIALDQSEGLAGAAAALHLSVPAVAKNIANLEAELGVELLDRSHYRATLNKYGRRLLWHARNIATEIDEAHRSLQDLVETEDRLIRFNAPPAFLPRVIPEAIHRVRKSLPGADARFTGMAQGSATQKLENLANGDFDLLINTASEMRDLSAFRLEPLARVQLKILTTRDHPAARLQKPTLQALRDYNWLLAASTGLPYEVTRQMFLDHGLPLPRNVMILPMREMLFAMLAKGEYLAVVSYNPQLFEHDLAHFAEIDIDCSRYTWTQHLIQRKHYVPNTATALFIRQLRLLLGAGPESPSPS